MNSLRKTNKKTYHAYVLSIHLPAVAAVVAAAAVAELVVAVVAELAVAAVFSAGPVDTWHRACVVGFAVVGLAVSVEFPPLFDSVLQAYVVQQFSVVAEVVAVVSKLQGLFFVTLLFPFVFDHSLAFSKIKLSLI